MVDTDKIKKAAPAKKKAGEAAPAKKKAGEAAPAKKKAGEAAPAKKKAGEAAPAKKADKPKKSAAKAREAQSLQRAVYFDANSTAIAPEAVVETVARWMNRGNPSAAYASAREARDMMELFRRRLAEEGAFELSGPGGAAGSGDGGAYRLLFTSGASESNCHVVTAAVRAYAARTGRAPHVILTAVEHWSLLACVRRLVRDGLTTATYLEPETEGEAFGSVGRRALEEALRANPDTCLVTVMAANNETGVVNDLKSLAAAARARGVPFHTDAVQVYGRASLRPGALGLDAFSASFHKMGGPPGVGLLAISESFHEGYRLPPHICGTQNGGLRGGTENVPGIAGAFVAFRRAMERRPEKNAECRRLRDRVWAGLKRHFRCVFYREFAAARAAEQAEARPQGAESLREGAGRAEGRALAQELAAARRAGNPVVVWLAPLELERLLPNTMLLAVSRPDFCNVRARAALEKRGVIVSVGSACNTSSPEASHVIDALKVPAELRPGVLRVSLPDGATESEADRFVAAFAGVVAGGDCCREP